MIPRATAIALLGGLCACIPDVSDAPAARPSVLLVVIDTLRFDHLSVYGYERDTTPGLERLAARGWVFERHVSHGAQTVPATLSMLLSQLPAEHGFVHRRNGQFGKQPPRYPPDLTFLAEVLGEAGYATAGFVGNPFLSAETGFDQGFDDFRFAKRDRALVDGAVDWLAARGSGDAPFFLYVHLMDVHWPYAPPPEIARRYREPRSGRLVYRNGPAPRVTERDLRFTVATYDAGIRAVDALVEELIAALDARGTRDDTIVVVTSDHGDEFLEHGGLGHGTTVYGELVRVPLIVVYPPRLEAGRRVGHLTQHLDLAPTLLALAGVEVPTSFRGRSLLEEPAVVFSEEAALRAVHGQGHKLVWDGESGAAELFALDDALDAAALEDPAREAALRAELDGYLRLEREREDAQAPAGTWSEDELESLRALGYVE